MTLAAGDAVTVVAEAGSGGRWTGQLVKTPDPRHGWVTVDLGENDRGRWLGVRHVPVKFAKILVVE